MIDEILSIGKKSSIISIFLVEVEHMILQKKPQHMKHSFIFTKEMLCKRENLIQRSKFN